MAETSDGRKFIRIPEHARTGADGKKVQVPAHVRSTPKTSTGKKPSPR